MTFYYKDDKNIAHLAILNEGRLISIENYTNRLMIVFHEKSPYDKIESTEYKKKLVL